MAGTRIITPSGRALGLFAAGDPSAERLVVVCHPSAGSAVFDPDPTVSGRWGVHLVALDRPGYGSSDPLPAGAEHRLVDRAADVADWLDRAERIADRISGAELRRFGVVGWGTGGLVAAAMAARFPERVDRLALVGVPAPTKAAKLARRAFIASPGPEALHVAEDDADLARHSGLWRRLGRMVDDAFVQGRAGVDADRVLMTDHSWVGLLPAVQAPTRIWLGRRDPVVDEGDVRWYAERIGDVTAVRVRDSGALTIAAAWRHVLDHVAPKHGSLSQQSRDEQSVRLAHVDPVHPDRG